MANQVLLLSNGTKEILALEISFGTVFITISFLTISLQQSV